MSTGKLISSIVEFIICIFCWTFRNRKLYSDIQAMVGTLYLVGGLGTMHSICNIKIHEEFNSPHYAFDIAILKVCDRIKLQFSVWPIFYDSPIMKGGEQVTVSGWSRSPDVIFFLLLYAYKWIIFKEKRKLLLGKRHIIFVSKLPGNMHNEWCWMRKQLSQVLPFKPFVYIEWRVFWSLLCKYHKQSIGNNFNVNWDIFQGDGGGPLVITNDAGGSVLVGIVSYGVP